MWSGLPRDLHGFHAQDLPSQKMYLYCIAFVNANGDQSLADKVHRESASVCIRICHTGYCTVALLDFILLRDLVTSRVIGALLAV